MSRQAPGAIFRDFLEELAHERIEKHEQTFFRLSVAEDVELLAQIFEPFLIDDQPGGLAGPGPYPERAFAEKVARVALHAMERWGMVLLGRYSRDPVYPEAFVEAVVTMWERGRPTGATLVAAPNVDSQDFYELMQAYRCAPIVDQDKVIAAFEAVKDFVRAVR